MAADKDNYLLFADHLREDDDESDSDEEREISVWNNDDEVNDAIRETGPYLLVIKCYTLNSERQEPHEEFYKNLNDTCRDAIFGKFHVKDETSKYYPEGEQSYFLYRAKFLMERIDGTENILTTAETKIRKWSRNYF